MGDHFEEGFEFEKPVHQVTVPDLALQISRDAISMDANHGKQSFSYFRGDDLPVGEDQLGRYTDFFGDSEQDDKQELPLAERKRSGSMQHGKVGKK